MVLFASTIFLNEEKSYNFIFNRLYTNLDIDRDKEAFQKLYKEALKKLEELVNKKTERLKQLNIRLNNKKYKDKFLIFEILAIIKAASVIGIKVTFLIFIENEWKPIEITQI